jgi:exodeoxyribonuclease V beta subunit
LSGANLIEASAGTGKTYTIEGLFVRLVLEKQLPVDQILVVTFTNAATEELRDRIRNKLLKTRAGFSTGSSDDPLVDTLVKQCGHPKMALQYVHEALINFDQAAIFTIHGFCQRILFEHAFEETGNLFDTELITDQADVLQEVVDDFWRMHFYNAALEFVNYASRKINGPQGFSELLTKVKAATVKIIPQFGKPALKNLQPYRKAYQRLKRQWPASRESVIRTLKSPALSGTYYGSLKPDSEAPNLTKRDMKILPLMESMERLTDFKSNGFPLFKDFVKFTTTYIHESTRKGQTSPTHSFFDRCEELYQLGSALQDEMDHYLLYLKIQLFPFANTELAERKQRKNIHYFDDLLILVKNALDAKDGNLLAESVRKKFKAALVDEFQDTDDIQYDIFTKLFAIKDHLLFMIGDPKQAIYGFRGADIFSYMKAARDVASKFTLTKNWRSDPGLITAVNTLFSNVDLPFVFNEIPFERQKAAKSVTSESIKSDHPLIIWFLDSKTIYGEEKIINKTDAVHVIAAAVAEEICRLITPGPSHVARGDIAVLVRKNRQAQLIKQHLSAKGIPSVLYSTGNIFDSHEAMETEKILTSISEPANIANLKAAYVMDMFGGSAEKLVSVDPDQLWWERQLNRGQQYYRIWHQYGFIRMFRFFMANENVKARLLSFPDGERRLTNVLHLAEVLQHASIEKNLGITGLVKWLAKQRDPSSARLEEHQLRLESDENAVKIVTIHKSKGLEYPVVFCPFGWEGAATAANEIIFHDIHQDMQLTYDLGSESQTTHRVLAEREMLAENLRLLYVALTRAKHRCYLTWGRINTAETSAMAYLLRGSGVSIKDIQNDDFAGLLKAYLTQRTEAELFEDLNRLAGRSKGSISLLPLPAASERTYSPPKEQAERLSCRNFLGNIDHSWKISSYSSLVSTQATDIDMPDYDSYPAAVRRSLLPLSDDAYLPEDRRFDSIFSFPGGARAGIFFHDLMEHIDFAVSSQKKIREMVGHKLQEYGFDKRWQKTICSVIVNVLKAGLPPGRKEFSLSEISLSHRINEVEFYFPLNPIEPRSLQKIFNGQSKYHPAPDYPRKLAKLDFAPSTGFLKGFIDMVFCHQGKFYLVDWKSNHLGSVPENYSPDNLRGVMTENLYILQYHLYTLALYQLLRQRKPNFDYEAEFGGVFYIFFRGVAETQNGAYGVFEDRPALSLINKLGKALIPGY